MLLFMRQYNDLSVENIELLIMHSQETQLISGFML
jgi:hypothetical protein